MDNLSRRRFFEQSLGAIIAATATGAAEKAFGDAPRRRFGANDKVNMAVVGVRSRGMSHVEAYLKSAEANLVAICDSDENVISAAMKAAEKAGKPQPKYYADIRQLLEDKNVDGVSIATPNHWHALGAIWAMQAGRDVYVEKPVSHNVREGRIIVDTARKYKKICQTGTQIRSTKGSRDAIAYIHSGKIGKIKVSRGLCYKTRNSIGHKSDAAIPTGVHYDLWLGPAPERPYNPNRYHYEWHWNWDYGNGDLGNQGIHQMDVARWALGATKLPKSVVTLGGRFGYVDDGNTPNTVVSVFDYGDAELVFEVRGLKTDPLLGARVGNIVYGTEGYVVFTGYESALAFDNNNNKVADFGAGGDHFGNFLQAVKSRKQSDLNADIEEGHLSSALCHLGNISYRLGKSQHSGQTIEGFEGDQAAMEAYQRFQSHLGQNGVDLRETAFLVGPKLKIDAHKEAFVGNKEANALLTREYRKPFVVPNRA